MVKKKKIHHVIKTLAQKTLQRQNHYRPAPNLGCHSRRTGDRSRRDPRRRQASDQSELVVPRPSDGDHFGELSVELPLVVGHWGWGGVGGGSHRGE